MTLSDPIADMLTRVRNAKHGASRKIRITCIKH